MGFHKRYIDDQQVISIFNEYGYKGIIDWYTRGVDAIITSGELSEHVYDILEIGLLSAEDKENKISKLISAASAMKDSKN